MRFSRIWGRGGRGGKDFFILPATDRLNTGRVPVRAVTRRVSTRGQRVRRQHAKLSRVYTCSSLPPPPPSLRPPSIGIADRRRRPFALSPSKRFTPRPFHARPFNVTQLCDPVCGAVCTHVAHFHAHRPLLITFNLASSAVVGGARHRDHSTFRTHIHAFEMASGSIRFDTFYLFPRDMRNIITFNRTQLFGQLNNSLRSTSR